MRTNAVRRGGSVILALCMLALLAWLEAGCAGAGGSASTSTTTGEVQRYVVGGKTAEEYAAELPDLEKAVAADPADLAALQELAVAQYNTQRYEEAATTYQKLLQLRDDAATHNNYANVLRDWKKIDAAKAEYEKAISADKTLVMPYVNLLSVFLAEGNLTEANKVLDRGIAATSGEDQARLKSYKEKLNSTTTTK